MKRKKKIKNKLRTHIPSNGNVMHAQESLKIHNSDEAYFLLMHINAYYERIASLRHRLHIYMMIRCVVYIYTFGSCHTYLHRSESTH